MKQLFKTACMALGLVLSPLVALSEVVIYGDESRIKLVNTFTIDRDGQRAFERFQRGRYFGAFAYDRSQDFYFFTTQKHDLRRARSVVMTACKARATRDSNCALYAELVPAGYDPKMGQRTLNHRASRAFRDRYLPLESSVRYGAFMISSIGEYGYSWGKRSKNEAVDAARADCLDNTMRERGSLRGTFRSAAYGQKDFVCRQIHFLGR